MESPCCWSRELSFLLFRAIMSSSEDNAPSLQVMEGSLVLETESSRSVRKRVPTARYLEEDSFELVKKICAEMSPTGKKRGRKSAAEKIHSFQCKESTSVNKWNAYKRKITQLARSVARDQHFIDSYEFDESDVTAKRSKHTPENELRKCNARIISSKKAIVEQFALLDAENAGHKHWLQLRTGFDEEDTVDVDDIMCSVCGEPDEENNDVLFCDRANCLRAYHQMCLDPPVLSLDEVSEDADWFCRQCACMDECLDMVGEVLGHDCDDFRELFPELRAKSGEGDASWMLVEDSESEDADYDPSELDSDQPHQVSEDEEEGSDTGKIPPPTGVEDVSDRNGEEDDSDSGDSDDSGDSGSDASDESSGVDQDELQGLLMDAEADGLLLDLPTTAQDGEPSSNSASAPRRNLRPRRAVTSPGANDKSRSPEGPADIGKAVAIVRRGVLIRGEIKAFRYRSANRNSPARVKKGKHRVTASTSPPPPSSASSSAPSQPTEFGACANSISAPIAVSPVAAAASVSASAGSRLGKEGGHGDGVAGLLSSGADYFCDSPPPPMGVASTYTAGQLLPAVENGNILEHCDGNTETYGRGSASAPAIDATQAGPPSLEDGMWTAKFDDDHIAILDLEALKNCFALYAEYAQKLDRDQDAAADYSSSASSNPLLSVLEEQGKLDAANVLTHKRVRKPLDYALLSLQMFGDVPDEDDTGSDDDDITAGAVVGGEESKRKRKRRRQKNAAAAAAAATANIDTGTDDGAADSSEDASDDSSVSEKRRPGASAGAGADSGSSQVKKRGRPRKVLAAASCPDADQASSGAFGAAAGGPSIGGVSASGKKRGRPPKVLSALPVGSQPSDQREGDMGGASQTEEPSHSHSGSQAAGATTTAAPAPSGKKRGRPRKDKGGGSTKSQEAQQSEVGFGLGRHSLAGSDMEGEHTESRNVEKKPRGRPKGSKNPPIDSAVGRHSAADNQSPSAVSSTSGQSGAQSSSSSISGGSVAHSSDVVQVAVAHVVNTIVEVIEIEDRL